LRRTRFHGLFHGQSIIDAGAASGSSASPQSGRAAQPSAGTAGGEKKGPDQVKV
jgi:hypothetical protein